MSGTFVGIHTGSFSTPAAGNPTVVMVEAAYRHHGIDARYLNCEVSPEDLGDAVAGAGAMGWAGFNCSLPHKVRVIDHLDGLAPSAEVIGAVNTVVATDGELVGHNTDGQGFVGSLRTVVDPAGCEVVVLGAGGAARAVAVETALAGAASVLVVNRDERRGEELARMVTAGTGVPAVFVPWDRPYAVPATADVLVHATSVGFGDAGALVDLELDSLRPGVVVSACSWGRAPSPSGTGPGSTPTGRSCGPPRRGPSVSRQPGSDQPPFARNRRPGATVVRVTTSEQRRIRCTWGAERTRCTT